MSQGTGDPPGMENTVYGRMKRERQKGKTATVTI